MCETWNPEGAVSAWAIHAVGLGSQVQEFEVCDTEKQGNRDIGAKKCKNAEISNVGKVADWKDNLGRRSTKGGV